MKNKKIKTKKAKIRIETNICRMGWDILYELLKAVGKIIAKHFIYLPNLKSNAIYWLSFHRDRKYILSLKPWYYKT